MHRFFYTPRQTEHDTVCITGSEARHIATVLRLRKDDEVELYDGKGAVVQGTILQVSGREVVISVKSRTLHVESGIHLTLVQAMLKGKKMDLLVQKATELGVHTFSPLISRYCDKRTCSSQQGKRWQRIMLEACKQCGRPIPMLIDTPHSLEEIRFTENCNFIMPWEDEDSCPLSPALLKPNLPTVLLIGPEGGFHPDEVTFARNLGFSTISLGPRILRAETAALTATAIVQYLSQNLNPVQTDKYI